VTEYRTVLLSERPDLAAAGVELDAAAWPEFMAHDAAQERYLPRLLEDFAAFQVLLLDGDGTLAAIGASIPFAWDGTVAGLPAGWSAVVEQGVRDLDDGRRATALAGLAISIPPERRGQGLSTKVLTAMKAAAAAGGLEAMVIPVRPSTKSAYPLIPMERYMRWTRQDGAPFDPWLRTHWRAGGKILGVCETSMEVIATVDQWEAWTGMRFPGTGLYLIPDALVPVAMDRERNEGRYVEPNVWVQHPM
jgi:GNAT superfamily N-acetyltransferase